uniref:Uncharacterized protein n=1 Tax=Arion vulgaris TaxID=1028688 RepID=A0A0B7AYV6_9EUPU
MTKLGIDLSGVQTPAYFSLERQSYIQVESKSVILKLLKVVAYLKSNKKS